MAGKAMYVKPCSHLVPIYNLMLFDYSKEGFRRLEKQSRELLWGLSAKGKLKVALIARGQITKPKPEGGLDLHPLREQARRATENLECYSVHDKWGGGVDLNVRGSY
jgi:hypothetical protein